jgi:hypothetical protein
MGLASLEGMSHTMRNVLGGAFLLGVGAAAWLRRESKTETDPTRRDAQGAGDDRPGAWPPGVRRRARGTRPPRHSVEPQPQDLDGGVTANVTGHNPGLMPRISPSVEDLGLRDSSSRGTSYGLSPSDVSGIYGDVVSPVPETEGDAAMAALPGDGTPDGQSWTDSLMTSAAETGVPPYESLDIEPGDRDDDIPVADRGAGGTRGL